MRIRNKGTMNKRKEDNEKVTEKERLKMEIIR